MPETTEEFDKSDAYKEICRLWARVTTATKWKSSGDDWREFETSVDSQEKFEKIKKKLGVIASDKRNVGRISLSSYLVDFFDTPSPPEPEPEQKEDKKPDAQLADIQAFFEQMWSIWPHPLEAKGKPSRGLTALAGRVSRSSIQDVEKVCNYYADVCSRPDANPKYFHNFANFFDDDDKFEEMLDRARRAPTEEDRTAWAILKKRYPEYPAKESDFAGDDAMEIWRYHVPVESRLAFYFAAKDFAHKQKVRWRFGIFGQPPEDQKVVEHYTPGIKTFVATWLAEEPSEYLDVVSDSLRNEYLKSGYQAEESVNHLAILSIDYCRVRVKNALKDLPRGGKKYGEVEKIRRDCLARVVGRFVELELKGCAKMGVEPSAWFQKHKNPAEVEKLVESFLLELEYKYGQRQRPVVESQKSVETRPGDPRQAEAAARVGG